ncbi:MAG: RNA polymerase factor sigma-54 [Paludibacteraceae bacterium]|nr:RNA polymerase factor sigma-54 [Paludibacteraceae bacterium]
MAEKNLLTQETTLKQKTTLTPLQIQEIRILEYPTLELEQRIEREIEENPGLEAGSEDKETNEEEDIMGEQEDALQNDEFDLNDYISDDDDVPEYRTRTNNLSPDDKQEDIPFSVGESFQEQLLSQLGLLKLSALEQKVAQYVIGNIDEDGYLRREPEQLVDDLAFKAGITIADEQMLNIIHLIQNTFEPAGVCARNLQECLILQLQRKQATPAVSLAITILEKKYKEFTAHHYQKIVERFSVTDEQLRDAIAEIQKLNPKPGNTYSQDVYNATAVIPDFIIEVEEGTISIQLNNGNIPELRVNREFNEMLQQYQAQPSHSKQEKDTIAFIKDRIDSARWFIDAIKQRNDTLLRTMRTIVAIQREYFLDGDEALLKPMILKDVADRTGYDVSTISRVSNSKYAQTPYGIFPLRYFFSESMTNNEGEEVATRTIKNALQDIINSEDPLAPLNDDELVVLLEQKGFPIARRTIAKYRKQLGIPVARLRKKI